MSALAFDTHAAVKKLQPAGFTEQQAEAQTALLLDVITGEVATKRDIETVRLDIENVHAELKHDMEPSNWTLRICMLELKHDIKMLCAELKHDIKMLCAELKHDIAELRRDMKEQELRLTIKLGVMLAITVVVMVILLKHL